jgi:hypothetical protein
LNRYNKEVKKMVKQLGKERQKSGSAAEKPVAAFTLALVGLVLQGLGAILVVYMIAFWRSGYWWSGTMMGPGMMGPWSGFLWPLAAALAAAVIGLGIVGVSWLNSAELNKVRDGSVLVLVASVIALPTMFGLIVGSLLMFVGGILGLTWQPSARR